MKVEEAVAARTSRKEVLEYLRSFKDINARKIGKFLGQGLTHRVYEYGSDKLVKVPKKGYIKKQESAQELKKSYELCNRYFRRYVWPSEIVTSPRGYIIIQKRFSKFEPLARKHFPEVAAQFGEIAETNKKLVRKHKYTIDFVGFGGAVAALKTFFGWKTEISLENFVVEMRGKKLRIFLEDFQLLNLNFGKSVSRNIYVLFGYRLSYKLNAFVVKRFFGYDVG